MKIYNEHGEQIGMSDILYEDIEYPSGGYSVPILSLAPCDITDFKERVDVEDVCHAGQKIGESEAVMSAFWVGVEEYFGTPHFPSDDKEES